MIPGHCRVNHAMMATGSARGGAEAQLRAPPGSRPRGPAAAAAAPAAEAAAPPAPTRITVGGIKVVTVGVEPGGRLRSRRSPPAAQPPWAYCQ